MTEPCDLSAREAARRIALGTLSASDLTESCIARIEAVDHAVNAMPVRDFDAARASAGTLSDGTGALHGLPIGIKLSEDVRGLASTQGSAIYANAGPAAADGPMVARLRRADAIVLGKTNAPEFNAGANTRNVVHGATGNPFDPARSAAGSSGGSAVALACGMVPLATGSDLGGSLRNPAAFCGVVGMRPSPGTIADPRAMGFLPLGVAGPMARDVGDVALLLGAMATRPLGHGAMDGDLGSLRVAATADFGFGPVDAIVRDTFAGVVGRLAPLVARLVETTPDCDGVARAFAVLRATLYLGAHGLHWREHRDLLGENVRDNYAEALTYSAADVAGALIAQTAFARRMDGFFEDHDLLIAPAVAISPPAWAERSPAVVGGRTMGTYYEWLSLAYPATLAGHPSLSLPVGRDARGMPFGLQLIGPRDRDGRLLAMAGWLEAAFAERPETARPVPDMAALRAAPPIVGMPGFWN